MGTRALTGLAVALFAAGCALGAASLDPTVHDHDPVVGTLGFLLMISSLPAWVVASTRKACATISQDQLTNARVGGYLECLDRFDRESGVKGEDGPRIPGARLSNAERHDQ